MTVYLIGGPPKCGKTTLAKILSKSTSIPRISADTLENIARTYIDKANHKKAFPHGYVRGDSNDVFYTNHTSASIVEGYIQQGKTSYKAISMMAQTSIIDKDDYIIEGYQVTPEIVSKIIKKFGAEHIRTIFLVKNDEKKFVQDIHKSTTPNDRIIRKTKQEETFHKIAKMIAKYSKYFEKEAKKYKLPVLEMDNNFEKQIKSAMNALVKK